MDLTVLAADHGAVPMNIGAVLELEGGPALGPDAVRGLLAARIPGIPRLRQRLWRPPPGCGRPLWIDDPGFDLDRHLSVARWPQPGGRTELLAVAAQQLCRRLRPDRPLWQACLVLDADHDRSALVVVLHHVLADGMGGLAVLTALVDRPALLGSPDPPDDHRRVEGREPARSTDRQERRLRPRPTTGRGLAGFPAPRPDWHSLAAEAGRTRLRSLARLPSHLRRGWLGLGEIGLTRQRPRITSRSVLNGKTGGTRRLAVSTVPLDQVLTLAHRAGGTVNDVVLAAISGALFAAAGARGDHLGELVVSVPVTGRPEAPGDRLGNNTGVRPIAIPNIADDWSRLTTIVQLTHRVAERSRATSAAPLGAAFRLLGRMGLFNAFIDHQRLVHTFESNLRGPPAALRFGERSVAAILPMSVSPGNVRVSFVVLSYAGTLAVTVVADPTAGLGDLVVGELERQLHRLASRLGADSNL